MPDAAEGGDVALLGLLEDGNDLRVLGKEALGSIPISYYIFSIC